MGGKDPWFSGFPAGHEFLYIRRGKFEPLAGGPAIAGHLIEVGPEAQDLIEYAKTFGAVCLYVSQQPALDGPINDIGAIAVDYIDVRFVVEEQVEGPQVFVLLDRDVEAVVSAAAANTGVSALIQQVTKEGQAVLLVS